eukprot:3704284-Pyramimonas_sp.AAC.1
MNELHARLLDGADCHLETSAIEGFKVDTGTPLGKRFDRWIQGNQAEYEKYKKMRRTEKAAERKKWCKDVYDEYQDGGRWTGGV